MCPFFFTIHYYFMSKILVSLAIVFSIIVSSVSPAFSATNRIYYNGPKGGCYYFTSSGKKTYVSHNYCDRSDESVTYVVKNGRAYYTGPKGGCFYYGKNWKKVYVGKGWCE